MDEFFNGPGQRVALLRDPGSYAVRFQRGARKDDTAFSAWTRRFMDRESEHVGYLARYDLQIFRALDGGGSDLVRRIRGIESEAPVVRATPVFRWSASARDLVFLNDGFLVEFMRDVREERARQEIARLNARYGVEVIARLGYTQPAIGYHLRAPAGDGERGPVELAKRYYESGLFRYAIPEIIQRRVFKAGPVGAAVRGPDGAREVRWQYEAEQWHLVKAGVIAAWAEAGTRGDPAIRIAIADDGIDVDHPELKGRLDAQYDFEANVADANPKSTTDRHGTACAGVAAALGLAASGAAPGCRLIGARFPDALGVADEARMFEWMADSGADVISCSWGPPDGTGARYPLPGNVAAAIRHCVTRGRGGRGTSIFWACGNGAELVSNDGYASNPDVIAVAACNEVDAKAYYSDYGPEVSLCAPSSGTRSAGHRYIFTTDRRGPDGYNRGDPALGDPTGTYTNDFGGTSAAAPLVAGIAALMLSVDPSLRAERVREILEQTAVKIGSGYDASGRSDEFGHGRVDALAAVRAVKRGYTPTVKTASAKGPATISRTADPPEFEVVVSAGRYYAIELATDPRLFERAATNERRPDTYFASWDAGVLSSDPRYHLPAAVWARLRSADLLYYRLLTSSSAQGWTDPGAVPPIAQIHSAPAIELLPSLRGPASADRGEPAPRFDVRVEPGDFYAVELATERELFAAAAQRPPRTADNFFASWQVSSTLLTTSSYEVPASAWARLSAAGRVYYRLLVSRSANEWLGVVQVPPVDRPEALRSIEVRAPGAGGTP